MKNRTLSALAQDARYAVRTLVRRPGFAAAIILTLGLAIGAAATIFAGVDALFLRALPIPEADRVMTLWGRNKAGGFDHSNVSYRDFEDWRREARSFESLAVMFPVTQTLTGRGEPEALDVTLVTGDFFRMIGARAAFGRLIGPADDRPEAPRAAVLTWASWRERFGADPAVVGRTLTLDGQPVTVVGVLSAAHDPGPRDDAAVVGARPEPRRPGPRRPQLSGGRAPPCGSHARAVPQRARRRSRAASPRPIRSRTPDSRST